MRLPSIAMALLFLALCQLGMGRGPLAVLAPSGTVTTPSFEIVVRVPPGLVFDPSQGVTVNGTPVPVTAQRGPRFAARLDPGEPLLDHNRIVVRATSQRGRPIELDAEFDYLPPKARAFRMSDPSQLITGPLAHGQVGDFMLENDVARFVIQDGRKRDLYSVGQYGGNLIDAELVGRPGLDNFLEVQSMANVESVFNAQLVEVVNDGQNGRAAIVRACGPDDLLDFANPSSFIVGAGLPSPASIDDVDHDIEGCTEYRLEPGRAFIEMETTVLNNTPVPDPANPPPGLSLVVGDWLNAAGEVDTWAKPFVPQVTALDPWGGVGAPLLGEVSLISFFGIGEAAGVDYGYTSVEVDDGALPPNAVSTFFNTSGVSVVLHNANIVAALLGLPSSFVVPAGGELGFRRFFSVGDGSGSNAVDMENAVRGLAVGRLEGCVRVGGAPLSGSRVAVGRESAGGIDRLFSNFVTREGACPNFSGTLPPGAYVAAAARSGAPYVGSAPTPPFTPVNVLAGETTSGLDFDLPAPGRLTAQVVDEAGRGLPARVTVVGFDPSAEPQLPGPSFPGFGGSGLALFNDPRDQLPFGIVAVGYADAQGGVAFDLEPGSYEVFVSRGTEYSAFRTPVSVSGNATTHVEAQIAHVIDTPGFVSSDFHVHGIRSADSRVSDRDRVFQFAGEGVENVVMTDHESHTDLGPAIAAHEMQGFLTSTIGEEITTFDYGHFNGYPFRIDPTRPSGGSTDWAQPAEAGCDFPAPQDPACGGVPAFNATPGEIFELAAFGPNSTPDTTVQINHIDSHFAPLQIDTKPAPGQPIEDGLDASERPIFRLDPAGAGQVNLFHHFPALEIWNGASRGAQEEFLEQRIGIWFNHLNKGLHTTMIADTDTHSFTSLRTAGARTWTPSTSDVPEEIDPGEVARAVSAGRAVGGQGIYVQTRLLARDESGGVAHFGDGGSTLVASSNGHVDLEIAIQAPLWAQFDSVEIYANADTVPVDPAAPYLYGVAAGEALVLKEGDCNAATRNDGQFDIDVVMVHPVTGGARQEVTLVLPFEGLAQDTWFVVLVKGSDGVCEPMFPVFASSLSSERNQELADLLDGNRGELGVMALGSTNPLYADVDGRPGFDPPTP